ncbi:hypothetical protein ACFE04_007228 [Oxalis oulophora]
MEKEDEIELGEVDRSTSKPVCTKVDIHSYPTFKVFFDEEEVKHKGNIASHRYGGLGGRIYFISFISALFTYDMMQIHRFNILLMKEIHKPILWPSMVTLDDLFYYWKKVLSAKYVSNQTSGMLPTFIAGPKSKKWMQVVGVKEP